MLQRRTHGPSLIAEVLLVQLVIAAVVGTIALIGLAWISGSVIRDNLAGWASQWVSELDELGAPFYVSEQSTALLDVERFIAKYPEIDRVTWYELDGGIKLSVDETGVIEDSAVAGDDPPAMSEETVADLADRVGSDPPYVLSEDEDARQRFQLSGPIWIESFAGDGLFDVNPEDAETVTELLGFVSMDLDFTVYESAFLNRLGLASIVLFLLLSVSWGIGRSVLMRALSPLSKLQIPLKQLADGDMNVKLPRARHRELQQIVGVLGDTIRALRKRERHLLHLANHDPLTGLLNRHRLMQELESEIDSCAGDKHHSALFFIDLDQFKYVNDTSGHAAGDKLLIAAAQQIRHAVREKDLVARFGGDEFVVLLPHVTRSEARRLANKVLELMRSLKHVDQNRVFHIQCSVGVTSISNGRFSPHEVIAQADMACHAAKHHGRNRIEVYNHASKQSEQMEIDVLWMRNIRRSLETNAFVLNYQPLLHIPSGEISHYEALLRIKTDRGLIGPSTFLPAAVRFGLMHDIDMWVIEAAIRAAAEYSPEIPNLKLSINLSSFAFEDSDLATRVRNLLQQYAISGDRIVLEITEHLAVRFAANTDKQVNMLRNMGCGFAVDDFGTGYSSFSYLKRLPVDYLKIDGSFVRDIERDRVDQSMVRMVAQVAQAASMRTVAEYVQSANALTLLRKYGIDYAQGSYIGRASPTPHVPDRVQPLKAVGGGAR